MYWPSTSQDGEYIFRHHDGKFLDPDTVLSTYHDWKDVSTWPVSNRVPELVKRESSKQKDPLQKPGLAGAFCRAYSIAEAVETFIPSYVPCSEPNRFTYAEGTTAAGVVVYDDKFSYSHHATDPASGQLCNAWDLVRLHLFHEKDENCDPDTPATSRPSYKAMSQMVTADERVKAQLFQDRVAEAMESFETPVEDDNWHSQLTYTEKGQLATTIENVVLILSHDPALAGRLAYNEMEHSIVTLGDLPWRESKGASVWADVDDLGLWHYLERAYKLSCKDKNVAAVAVMAQRNAFHPVRDYLDSCEWDGIPRVETLLVDCLGAEDTPYVRAVTRKTLVAAVARIYQPGIKFDNMLTLQGVQGIGKSSLLAKLGGDWFSDTFTTMQGKEAYEQVQGVWLMEIGELDSMKKAETSTVKLFISKTSDRYRPAYGRRIQEFPRQCVFFGTTNETQFLRDTTGNRRFWVVETPNAQPRKLLPALAALDSETVRRIWGEAVTMYKAGEQLYLTPELEAVASEIQESFEEENPKVGIIGEYLDRLLPPGWDDMDTYARRQWLETNAVGTVERKAVCAFEIWAEGLRGNPDRIDRYALKEIHDIMAKLPGWRSSGRKQKTIKPYGRQRLYERMSE